MTSYQLIADSEYVRMTRNGTTSIVPNEPLNTDWQQYQEWLALGNEPEPAE